MTNPDHINQCKREPFIERVKEENGEGCNIDGFVEMSHKINKLSFGKEFPGVINPLYRLFLQSILISEAVKFTPTRNADAYLKLPAGVYFFYDFSPIKNH
ncbi:endoplasmic reticulum-Golgi intermediate compartment protein 3-like isoform X2 [Zingiber officinale]|uniref:endoplasmic reticulum-Golgi intermediate compartment protein 3-like isoform X2 n=1 Tax=Zingiber officinale TaxID=94328 RepID=UPI001C4C724F|nr:endoplasmic reticulum-Golgi intermediate compartment protein 3-like isoform X2 [Zingiber officinale]